jgi:hypothetical protein
MSDERRKHARVPVPAQGACTIKDEAGEERSFELIDLSESGARLSCAVAIDAMTRVHVALRLPGERVGQDEAVTVETVGVVVWSHPRDEGGYDTGVFFPELDDKNGGLLQAYVLSAA